MEQLHPSVIYSPASVQFPHRTSLLKILSYLLIGKIFPKHRLLVVNCSPGVDVFFLPSIHNLYFSEFAGLHGVQSR